MPGNERYSMFDTNVTTTSLHITRNTRIKAEPEGPRMTKVGIDSLSGKRVLMTFDSEQAIDTMIVELNIAKSHLIAADDDPAPVEKAHDKADELVSELKRFNDMKPWVKPLGVMLGFLIALSVFLLSFVASGAVPELL